MSFSFISKISLYISFIFLISCQETISSLRNNDNIDTVNYNFQLETEEFLNFSLFEDYKDDVRVILFVTTKNHEELNDEKIKLIKSKIRKNCSPKHVPSIIIKVPEIPRTKSGKIVELAVRQIINGEKINNKEAIANPEALKFFEKLPQLKL